LLLAFQYLSARGAQGFVVRYGRLAQVAKARLSQGFTNQIERVRRPFNFGLRRYMLAGFHTVSGENPGRLNPPRAVAG
jgi:hypothetical protein